MCGILGWINLKENLSQNTPLLKDMLRTLSYRGPDAEGIATYEHALFGHRRLTVVDPEGGKQPMTKRIGGTTYTIVYNGELYNTEDIRKLLLAKGYTFDSYSDTEVLLTSYIEWKEKCVDYLNGIYAFAVWDEWEQKAFLCRDPLGVKPLFFSLNNGNLIFASELKAILAHPEVDAILGEDGILELFGLGPARSLGSSIFEGIEEVPPGHYLLYSKDNFRLVEYWTLEAQEHTESLEDTIDHVRTLVVDAIERQLVSDVPLATFLSGGLDSSAISAIAANYFKENSRGVLNTYSINYEENEQYFKSSRFQPNSDHLFIDRMVNAIGSHHTNLILSQKDLVDALDEAVYANDLPGMADIDSSLYLFTKEIRKHETVVLSGECADEIFGGYPWFTRHEDYAIGTFPWSQSLELRKSLLGDQSLPLEDYVQSKYNDTLCRVPLLPNESTLDKKMREMFYLNIKWFMVTLLNRKDRMTMRNGLEVRVPFADHRIVEYTYNLPHHIKLLHGREKGLLREALKGILPESIIDRKKSPYPKTHHPLYTKLVQERLEAILNDSSSPLLDLIDRSAMREFIKTNGQVDQPWYGQLMTGPQVMAYFIQMNTWLKHYHVKLK